MVFKCNLTMIVSLQSKHNFGKGVLSIFLVKIIATMMVAEGWVEKEICTKEVSDCQKEGERNMWYNSHKNVSQLDCRLLFSEGSSWIFTLKTNSPKWRWIVVDIHQTARQQGIYLGLSSTLRWIIVLVHAIQKQKSFVYFCHYTRVKN